MSKLDPFAPPAGFIENSYGGATYYVRDYYEPLALTTRTYDYFNNDSYTGFTRLAGKIGNLALIVIFPLNLTIIPFIYLANWLKADYYKPFALTTRTYHYLNDDSYTGFTRLACRIGNLALIVIVPLNLILLPLIYLANGLKYLASWLKIDLNKPFTLTTNAYHYLNDDSYTGLKHLAGKVGNLALIVIVPLNLTMIALNYLGYWHRTEKSILAKLTVETRTDLTNENPFEFEADLGEKWNSIRDNIAMNLVSFEWLAKNLNDEELLAAWFWEREEIQKEERGDSPLYDFREYVWGARKALARQETVPTSNHPSPKQLAAFRQRLELAGQQADAAHTPTFNDLFPEELINKLEGHGVSSDAILHFRQFMKLVGDKRAFRFLRNLPGKLAYYDKVINDAISKAVPGAKKPVVASTVLLLNQQKKDAPLPTFIDLSARLVKEVFSVSPGNQPINVSADKVAEAQTVFETARGTFDLNNPQTIERMFKDLFCFSDRGIDPAEFQNVLKGFCTNDGLKLIYCLYHLLDLKLVSDARLLKDVDALKETFAICPLSRPLLKSLLTKQQLGGGSTTVQLEGENGEVTTLFSQETDQATIDALTHPESGLFHPIDRQKESPTRFDALVFLNKKIWDPNYTVLEIEPLADGTEYPEHDKKRVMVILATEIKTGRRFVLMCGHGDSQNAEDGRRQVRHMMATYEAVLQEYPDAIPIIGTNGNTKTGDDLQEFANTVNLLKLQQLDYAIANAMKCRLHSAQYRKVGKREKSRSSNIVTSLDPKVRLAENSTLYGGFPQPNTQQLPSVYHPSDQLPIRTTIELAN